MHEGVARQLSALDETIPVEAGAAERQQAVLDDLRRLSEEGRAVTLRLAATGHLPRSDLDWLNRATHEVPRLIDELTKPHEFRITSLNETSQYLIQAIVVLYAAFTVAGLALVLVARFVATRSIAAPLRRLADAAQGIAERRLETRVPVRHANEIGLLPNIQRHGRSRLQEHEREMRSAHDSLEKKVREVRALYQIGTEIARFQQLDRILQLVVDKARELLQVDVAVLRLFAAPGEDLVAPARAGPPRHSGRLARGQRARPRSPRTMVTRPRRSSALSTRGVPRRPHPSGGKQLGTIYVGTCAEREFTEDDAEC